MEQTGGMKFQGILMGSKKDLGEQIQERMRTRQEVRWWMGVTTEMGSAWYNSPHYQRVTLHALCQLAVTWQGEKCTVDKDLLFHYIPQLFSHTRDGLQLLYAVQCVLHNLQNSLTLGVAFLQAVLTISRPDKDYRPLITTSDWDKWRNTQNPFYDEGRNIIQQLGQFLDLLDLTSSKATLTEINVWISKNIPQDKMLDAFIIVVACLLNREEEVTLIRDWISLNVPQSMQNDVQDALKAIITGRCVQRIQSRDYKGLTGWINLADWVNGYVRPAWRSDTQFVRAVIKAVCERTIHSDKIDYKDLRLSLGALNCLYDASESLQLQALDSVYDHVRTVQHPEKVLQKIMDVMWSDGYISRQVILSWSSNMEQTGGMKFQGILMGSKKDLGEQIQERMRAKQEVTRWMGDTTGMRSSWYDSPHYQRVALHALCQLAVTWQGDHDKPANLFCHYIPQFFCYAEHGLQLLYAVQCVLHHLQNPPRLAVAVLQALLTISRSEYKPLITTTDWDKWRNTQNPAYDEGRNIIQQQGQILDSIFLMRSKMTLTEIKGWISANIPQDQMADAFIMAAECLLNRGEEVTLIRDWISQNVPQSMQTAVLDTLKTRVIESWEQRIQSLDYWALTVWVDEHILPAWRQDAHFVRAVIRAVCERTIHADQTEKHQTEKLRGYLGVLNCMYGAPEALQLQALDSVYDHVITLQHHEKVLQQVLDIMIYDGYLSRQAILSWSGNMEQDLGGQIQETMKARQDVRRLVGVTIQLGYFESETPSAWYDLPHYQRVVLHALCQLAVTWQGDKCTVDKDLLFHYIPQLFGDTKDGLQLLYAVQCVLHHLQNPPGLTESVLEALVSPIPPRAEPIITESDQEKWIKAEHPAYEEGRESMLIAIK